MAERFVFSGGDSIGPLLDHIQKIKSLEEMVLFLRDWVEFVAEETDFPDPISTVRINLSFAMSRFYLDEEDLNNLIRQAFDILVKRDTE